MGANINFGLLQQRFFFIRHGQTDWNKKKLAMGQSDVPLNQHGQREALQAAALLRDRDIQHIYHSPLIRARATAELIAEELALPCQEISSLSQCNWGEMQGQPRGDESWRMAWRRGEIEIAGAESFATFCQRVQAGVNQALMHGVPVLIVAHGATFAAIQRALHLDDKEMQNCLPLSYMPPAIADGKWQVAELTHSQRLESIT